MTGPGRPTPLCRSPRRTAESPAPAARARPRAAAPPLALVILLLAAGGAAAAPPVAGGAAAAPPADDGRIHGKVVAITAGEVYVDFGAAAGLRVGDPLYLSIGREEIAIEVVDVAPSTARAALPDGVLPPRIGDPAAAARRAVEPAPPPTARTAPPDPAEVVAARWRGVDLGRPRRIAFRGGAASGAGGAAVATPAVRGAIGLDYLGVRDLRSPARADYHRLQVRSSLDLAPPALGWLDYSHRMRLRLDFEPDRRLDFPASRDALLVYRLRAGLTGGGLRAEIGRTEAAPVPGAGLIDGAAVRYRVGSHLYLGGFGGASPQILDLAPTLDGYRFGAYASLRDTIARGRERWRMSADLGLVGTTFDGAVDRRALGARAAASGERGWLAAQALIDFYPADHPAGRPRVDLSTATLDAGARWGRRVRASVGFDRFRAERTREALAVLPADFLSTTGYSSARGNLALGLARRLDLDLRAGYRWPVAGADALWLGGGLHRRGLLLRDDHARVGGDGAVGTYQDGGSLYLGYGLPLHPRVDVDAGYRLAGYRYGAEDQRLYRHWLQLGIDAWPGRGATVQLELEACFGDEERALTTFASTQFRF